MILTKSMVNHGPISQGLIPCTISFYALTIYVVIEVRPLSVSDTLDVSGTYLKIINEPNRIILKFRFATIQILQKKKNDLYRIRIAIWKKKIATNSKTK